jgi:hypothetical protein
VAAAAVAALCWMALAAPRVAGAAAPAEAVPGMAAPAPPSGELTPIGAPVPFGTAVAISGDTAAVTGRTPGGRAEVFLFVRSAAGWSQQARIFDPAGADMASLFGSVLALSGDTLAVGAGADGAPNSSVYIYLRSGGAWSLQAHLQPPDGVGHGFGAALALAADTLVAGVPGGGNGAVAGAAFVYARSGGAWSRQAVLSAKTSAAGDRFGLAVAVAHRRVAVGGPGFVEVFEPKAASWQRTAVLHGAAAGLTFGSVVAASDETVAVGDPGNGEVSVFIHTSAGWFHQADIAHPAGAGEFGASLALSQDALAVGAPGTARTASADSGAVYVYVRLQHRWLGRGTFALPAPVTGERFGSAVAVSLHTAVVGSTSDSPEPRTAWLLEELDHP